LNRRMAGWINVTEVGRLHREKFPKTKMTRQNMEHAFVELFGFPQVMQSCLTEALGELERREQILSHIFTQLDKQHRVQIDQGKNIFMLIRGSLFSDNWWEMFLLRRQVPLAPLHFDEIEVELCSRLFAISLDRIGSRPDIMTKVERVSDVNEKRTSRLSRTTSRSRSITRSRSIDSIMDETDERTGDDGKTKMLKSEMKRAYQDNNRLPILVEVAESSDGVDDELMEKAKRLIDLLTEKKNLKNAISQKEIDELEKTLKRIESKGLKDKLKTEYGEGSRLLSRLQTNERMRHEILALKQPTISEIRSYNTPPKPVRLVMMATYLLLGEPENDIQDWRAIQALVGKLGRNSLKQRIGQFKPDSIDEATALKAKTHIEQLNLDEIRDVSAGAATFYVWCDTMIQGVCDTA